ncbi:MAG: hypothetical protein J6Y68_03335 [Clostridia bacterium]|nr:hypothetical protein [Clostridia bacterium]
MSTGVIDVGSASVRLLHNGKRIVKMTKLAEGLNASGVLSLKAMKRTAEQIEAFVSMVRKEGDECVAFATESVRAATNRGEFINLVEETAGLKIEIISEFEEAELALFGACPSGSGTVIDIGGASVEIVSGEKGDILYAKSLPLGAVRLTERSNNKKGLGQYIAAQVHRYGDVKLQKELYGVGGTLTSLAAMAQHLKKYDPSKVHGYYLTLSKIEEIERELISCNADSEILEKFPSLQPLRAGIILAGTILSKELLVYLKKDGITISEADNLDGYIKYKQIR